MIEEGSKVVMDATCPVHSKIRSILFADYTLMLHLVILCTLTLAAHRRALACTVERIVG